MRLTTLLPLIVAVVLLSGDARSGTCKSGDVDSGYQPGYDCTAELCDLDNAGTIFEVTCVDETTQQVDSSYGYDCHRSHGTVTETIGVNFVALEMAELPADVEDGLSHLMEDVHPDPNDPETHKAYTPDCALPGGVVTDHAVSSDAIRCTSPWDCSTSCVTQCWPGAPDSGPSGYEWVQDEGRDIGICTCVCQMMFIETGTYEAQCDLGPSPECPMTLEECLDQEDWECTGGTFKTCVYNPTTCTCICTEHECE